MNEVLNKLQFPAVGLIILGCLNGFAGLFVLLSGVLRFSGALGQEQLPTNEAERIGFYIGTFIGYGGGLLSLIFAPLIVYGGIQMLKGTKIRFARVSAILSMLPFTACCFILGLPFGIWSLIVLSKPDVKELFKGSTSLTINNPPQPPNF